MNKKLILITITIMFAMNITAENYNFYSDWLSNSNRAGEEVTILRGNVTITSESREFRAGEIIISGNDFDHFEGNGSVYVHDYEENVVLKAFTFDYVDSTERLYMEGQVVMEDRANETILKCRQLDLFNTQDMIIMRIDVRIFQDDIICRADYAIYRRNEEILELSGSPIVIKGEDRYSAETIFVDLKNDEIYMNGDVAGNLTAESSSEEENQDEIEIPEDIIQESSEILENELPLDSLEPEFIETDVNQEGL